MWAYIFGAICPRKGKGAGLVLPYCDTEAMQDHLAEISQAVDPGAHAVLILDQAGWHVTPKLRVPDNMTLMFLPPRSPNSTRSKTSGSSCGTTGYRTGSSKTTTISSTNAAVLGTGSSINLGKSCPSECGNGRIGHDQRPLVLPPDWTIAELGRPLRRSMSKRTIAPSAADRRRHGLPARNLWASKSQYSL
jgi:hypothetical protein